MSIFIHVRGNIFNLTWIILHINSTICKNKKNTIKEKLPVTTIYKFKKNPGKPTKTKRLR